MLQPRTYPELLGKALTFDADPFVVMVDDDEPWIEGLFMTVLVGILAGGAQVIGGWLLTLSMPPSDAVLEAVLRMWRIAAGSLNPALLLESEATIRNGWDWLGLVTGYGAGWGRLMLLITTPLLLLLQWATYGFVGHGIARLLGGSGALNRTLGAAGLVVAPQVLVLVKIIPFVSLSNLLLIVWSTLIAYRALEVAHELPWRRAIIAAVIPPILFLLIIGGLVSIIATTLIFGSV